MDVDQDGVISLEDFLTFHKNDQNMDLSMEVLKTFPI